MSSRIGWIVVAVCSLGTLAACDSRVAPRNCGADADCGPQGFCASGSCAFDDAAPAISIDAPTQGQFTNGETLTLAGRIDDGVGSGVATAEYSLDGVTFLPLPLAGAAFAEAAPTPNVEFTQLTVLVRASDRVGNAASQSVEVFVDRVGPSLELTAPIDEPLLTSSDPALLAVAGTVTDANFQSLVYELDGGAPISVAVESGQFAFSAPVPDEDYSRHEVVLTATDTAGNTTRRTVTYFVDRVAPVVALESPDEGEYFSAAVTEGTLSGQIGERALREATWQLDGGAARALTVTGGRFEATFTLALEDGAAHQIVLRAVDESGQATTVTRNFLVDRVAPVIVIAAPYQDATCARSCTGAVVNADSAGALRLAGTAVDRGGLERVEVHTGGLFRSPATVTGSNWTFDWTVPASNGEMHTLRAVAVDKAGNSSEASRAIWVDRLPPTGEALVDGRRLVGRGEVLLRFSEPMDPDTVRSATRVNGAPAAASLDSSDGLAFAFGNPADLPPYELVSLAVSTAAADRAGNRLTTALDQTFLTAQAAPTWSRMAGVSAAAIAVDHDGRPAVAAWDSNLRRFIVRRWTGSQLTLHPITLPEALDSGRADDLAIDSWVEPGGIGLALYAQVVLVGRRQSDGKAFAYWAESTDLETWTSVVQPGGAEQVFDVDLAGRASIPGAAAPVCVDGAPDNCARWELRRDRMVRLLRADDGYYPQRAATYKPHPTFRWSTFSSVNVSPPMLGMRGDALASGNAIFLATLTDTQLPINGANGGVFIDGRDLFRTVDATDPLRPAVPALGSAQIAWTSYEPGTRASPGRPDLHLACAREPSDPGSWRRSDLGISAVGVQPTAPASALAMALSDTRAAVAVASGGQLFVATWANDDCAAAPFQIAWRTPLAGSEPSVAFAPAFGAGTPVLWMAYLDSAGELALARIE